MSAETDTYNYSVIVPVFNVEEYLSTSLDSILNQTLKDIEIIVVNDGSPDNSQKIIDKYTKKYSNMKCYIKENGGVDEETVKNLINNAQVIKDLLIPIPPLAEQERIVSILDRFEALTTDLTTGLPAEIKARQQQYEYYRDQLLTFKRAN